MAREQACDEAVLALGTRPSNYARVLLELAESMQPSAAGAGALPMVERSLMETRLMAILNDEVRPATRRWRLAPAIAVALFTLGVAAAQPAVRAAGSERCRSHAGGGRRRAARVAGDADGRADRATGRHAAGAVCAGAARGGA